MNPAQRITAYLKAHTTAENPISRGALKDAMTASHADITRKTVTDRLHKQIDRGMVGTDGKNVWFIRDREHRKPELSAEEKRQRKRARETSLRRANGIQSWSEFNAERAKRKADRKAAQDATKAESRRKVAEAKESERRALEEARIAKMAAKLAAANKARRAKVAKDEHAARDRRVAAQQVVAMRLDSIASSPTSQKGSCETVEQYLARGGVIEYLPPGQWARPLAFEY